MNKKITLLIFLFSPLLFLQAQENQLKPITKTYALKDVRIIQKPGQMIEVGTVVVKNGLIQAVGTNVNIPFDAQVLEADSMYVYAGFMDGLSHTGVPKPEKKDGENNRNQRDAANPTNERAGIQPEINLRDVLSPDEKSIADMRKLGFTVAHAVPRGKMLPGSGSLILMNGKTADEMILKSDVSLFSQFKGGGGVYPATKIAVMAKFRELYHQAEQAKNHQSSYRSNSNGINRPTQNRVLEAFFPVLNREKPVFYTAEKVRTLHQVYNLQKELGFNLVLANVKQGWYLADKIKSQNTKVVLSLDLPDAKDKKSDKEKDDAELAAFKKKQEESLKNHRSQAAVFAEKGIDFSFCSIDTKSKDIRGNLRTMIENGLPEEKAIAALTTVPARQFGVSNILGTVEKGKIANLVVTDKPYFEEKSNVRFVFVDGKKFDYEVKKKKKSDPNAVVDVNGKWEYKIVVPGMEISGKFTFKNEDGDLSGTIESNMEAGEQDLQNVELEGNELSFDATANPGGGPMTVSYTLTIEGENLEGNVEVGEFGTFDVEGSKLPE